MKTSMLLTAIVTVALIASISGCICCCGADGWLSKMKKPVNQITVPAQLAIDGKSYNMLYSYDYLNRSSAKAGFKEFIPRAYYSPAEYGNSVDQMMDVGGVNEYKWFEYTNGSGNVSFGGFLAKTGSPLTVDAGFQSFVSMLHASMPSINDPLLNSGGARNITEIGNPPVAGGSQLYHFTARYNGSTGDGYFIIAKYSNMYVAVYSFESPEAAEAEAMQAVQWIDRAAADP